MDVGGRYQTIQVYLSGCSDAVPDVLLLKKELAALGLMSGFPLGSRTVSFSRSPFATALGLVDSIAIPGVFGVFADKPKDAKAPEPSPNAEEAPAVGEATLVVVVKGVMPLSGVLPLGVLSPPNRLVVGNVRDTSGLPFSLLVVGVVSEVLLELRVPRVSESLDPGVL